MQTLSSIAMRRMIAGFAVMVLLALVGVSIWASGHQPIAAAIADLLAHPAAANNPWFVATLFDAYCGFLWFWLWLAYRERAWLPRLAWLVAILSLGNMAMAGYVLLQLWRLPAGAPIETMLCRKSG